MIEPDSSPSEILRDFLSKKRSPLIKDGLEVLGSPSKLELILGQPDVDKSSSANLTSNIVVRNTSKSVGVYLSGATQEALGYCQKYFEARNIEISDSQIFASAIKNYADLLRNNDADQYYCPNCNYPLDLKATECETCQNKISWLPYKW